MKTRQDHLLDIDQWHIVVHLINILHRIDAVGNGWERQADANSPYSHVWKSIFAAIAWPNGNEYAEAFMMIIQSNGYEMPTNRDVELNVPIAD